MPSGTSPPLIPACLPGGQGMMTLRAKTDVARLNWYVAKVDDVPDGSEVTQALSSPARAEVRWEITVRKANH